MRFPFPPLTALADATASFADIIDVNDSTPLNPLSRERQGQSEPVHSQCDGLIQKFWGNYLINNDFDGTLWNIRWNMMEHWDQMDAGYVIDARIDQHPAAIAVSGAGILSWQDRNLARIIATVAPSGVKCDARVQNVTRHKSFGVAMGESDKR